MNMSQLLGAIFTCLLALTSKGSFAAAGCPDPSEFPFNGCTIDGVRPGGFPYFDQSVSVRRIYQEQRGITRVTANFLKDISSSVVSSRSDLYVTPTDILEISRTKFKLRSVIDNESGVATGTVEIWGKVPDLGINNRNRPLMTADLSGEWGLNGIGDLIGFNTTNINCHNKIVDYLGGDGCTENESVYLSLLESIVSEDRIVRTEGVAVTTVPVPAAAWLFGSGMLGLIGISRRKKTA